eukprot:1022364-Rhodomonas_salina.1
MYQSEGRCITNLWCASWPSLSVDSCAVGGMLAPLDHCCCCCLLPCACTSCSGLTGGGGRGVMTAPVRDR